MEDLGDTFRLPAAPGEASSRSRCDDAPECVTLVFLEGPLVGQVVPIRPPRAVVGRRDDVDITLASQSVSKEHCVFTVGDGVVEIEDLGSTNGVAINGTRLQPGAKRRLFHGDSIRLAENLALLRQAGCFQDSGGMSRIQIDQAQVATEVDHLLDEFGKWARGG
jgi:pSer/pThr/pTyr-binding forkhead associated (FHA) protein